MSLLLQLFVSLSSFFTVHICDGFLPQNHMQIPVGNKDTGGLTEAQFNDVMDRYTQVYAPIFQAAGGNLKINRHWDDATVNAFASRNGSDWMLDMFGGLARFHTITPDAFLLVVCHETGHHLGGAPKKQGFFGFGSWAANEGQADYYANLRCFRKMNEAGMLPDSPAIEPDDFIVARCRANFSTPLDIQSCERATVGGYALASLFNELGAGEGGTPATLSYQTPDPTRVDKTFDDHPAPQCRLDTYFAGSQCPHLSSEALSDTDPNLGTCSVSSHQLEGARPACWYKDSAAF